MNARPHNPLSHLKRLLTGSRRRDRQLTAPIYQVRPYRDVAFIAMLLAVAAIPLLVLRYRPDHFSPIVRGAFWLVEAALFAGWVLPDQRVLPGALQERRGRSFWSRATCSIVGMTTLLVMVYYLPMREHFWGGFDELNCFVPTYQAVWSPAWDSLSRPLWGLAPLLGSLFTPDSVDGFLWTTAALNLLNGILLAGIVRRVLPGEPAIAAAAGILLLCHRGDPSRFFVLWTTIWYWTSLALMLLGTWLFLESSRAGNRGILVIACVFLGASLLGCEAGFPVATFGPILLYLSGIRGNRFWVWSTAWLGTIGVLALRFIQYLLHAKGSYQSQQAGEIYKHREQLLENIGIQMEPFLRWFDGFSAIGQYRVAAIVAVLAAIAVVMFAGKASARGVRHYVVGVIVSAAVAFVGVVAFIHLSGTFRTQFYSAVGQAALIAIILGGVSRILGRRVGLVALAMCTGIMAGVSASNNREFQSAADKYVNFVKTVHVLRQVCAATSSIANDNAIVLVPEESRVTPLGQAWSFRGIAYKTLGCTLVQHDPDLMDSKVVFQPDRVDLVSLNSLGVVTHIDSYPYEKLILFRVSEDGTLSLLSRIPDDVNLVGSENVRYDPLRLLRPGPLRELPFMRYSSWMKRPQDVIEVEEGFVFGEGWSEMQTDGGRLFRLVKPGGEIVVNSLNQSSRTLRVEVESAQLPVDGSYAIEIRGADGRVLNRQPFHGREALSLTVPTDPSKVSLVSVWAGPDDRPLTPASAIALRAYARPGAMIFPRTSRMKDISKGGLKLGDNWYPLELSSGETFRWFNANAEIVISKSGAKELILSLAGGPGLGGVQRELCVFGPGNSIIYKDHIDDRGRREIHCPLPNDLPAGATLRIEISGAGVSIAPDPRILKARVFWMELLR